VRTNSSPRSITTDEHIRVLVLTRHRPAFVATAKRRSSGYDRGVAVYADVHVITARTFKLNFVVFEGGERFGLAAHVTQRVGQNVLISHQAIERGEIALLKSHTPFVFDLFDVVLGKRGCAHNSISPGAGEANNETSVPRRVRKEMPRINPGLLRGMS
jgi:hypothetical protein